MDYERLTAIENMLQDQMHKLNQTLLIVRHLKGLHEPTNFITTIEEECQT
jgi:hypothetical protein